MHPGVKIGLIVAGLGALVACCVGAWVGYRMFSTGFSAKAEPGAIEILMARQVRHLAIPLSQRNAPNPVPLSPAVLQEGLHHFADHCATCHANDGSGKTAIGQGVYPKAPDLREAPTQSLSDGEIFFVIHNGIRFTAMPAWGKGAPEADFDSWTLVHFIRHLPKLTPEELETMKQYNPKTKAELSEEQAFDAFLGGEEPAQPPHAHSH